MGWSDDGDWNKWGKGVQYLYGLVMIPMNIHPKASLGPWLLCSGLRYESFEMYNDDIKEIST